MGNIKDSIIEEDQWSRFELQPYEFNYLHNMHTLIESQQQYLEGMLVGFMKLVAIRNGYDPTDNLEFDIDFEHPGAELKVHKVVE